MTDKRIKRIKIQLKLISDYMMNVALGLDDLEYDDITMTEEYKKEIIKGMYGDSYKLGLAINDLQNELLSEIPEWKEVAE